MHISMRVFFVIPTFQICCAGCAQLATFDAGGVSGHPNHIDTAKGVIQARRALNIPCFQLETTNIARKYSGPLDIFWSMYRSGNASTPVAVSAAPLISYRAMQAHHSQFVWFRHLFVIFSRYTFMNTWTPVA
jgi:N-acetylglucosaminylphosphatidylinositol deacetylase